MTDLTPEAPGPDIDMLRRLHEEQRVPNPGHISKLPKPTKRDNEKGKCRECGGWHGLPAVHLDYMGHAEVTDVLLDYDPTWTWAPFAIDQTTGLPMVQTLGADVVLWINLTIGGVTRPAVGTAPKGKEGDALKELIGDALRNGALRFGIATSLWSKADGVERDADNVEPAPIPDGALRKDDAKKRVAAAVKEGFPAAGTDYIKATAAGIWTEAEADKYLTVFNGAPYLLGPEVTVLDSITKETITDLLKAPVEGAA